MSDWHRATFQPVFLYWEKIRTGNLLNYRAVVRTVKKNK